MDSLDKTVSQIVKGVQELYPELTIVDGLREALSAGLISMMEYDIAIKNGCGISG
jgi:predicted RNA-binding protein associated with RNAse of E/G family